MAVYYKFKSAKDFTSVPVHTPFISVWDLKNKIFYANYLRVVTDEKKLKKGTDFDLLLTNARTNEDYTDEATLIPRNTAVLVRRIPGLPCKPIIIEQEKLNNADSGIEEASESRSTLSVVNSSDMSFATHEESEGYDFENDIFANPKVGAVQSSKLGQTRMIVEERKFKELEDKQYEEDGNIKAFVKGFGRGTGIGMTEGRGIGRGGLWQCKTPPQGYICHRCQVPGHFIQHCPTNGDPSYDIKRLKRSLGIPKLMLAEAPDGSYALPNGSVSTLKPNEASFSEAIVALPSAPLSTLPPELCCPLCKEIMKDAAFTSKCCFRSFCDKCIRDHIISKSVCACGSTEVLADTLIPNKTLREIIIHFLESRVRSEEKTRSSSQPSESKSSCLTQSKVAAPALSAPAKEECAPACKEGTSNRKRCASGEKVAICTPQKTSEESKTITQSQVITEEARSGNELVSHGDTPPLVEEKIKQRQPVCKPEKKNRKNIGGPANVADLHWGSFQESMAPNHFINFGLAHNYPYWASMQAGSNGGYMVPYCGDAPSMGGYMANSSQDPFGRPLL